MPTLSEVQGPLKQRYRDDPDAAKVQLSATGQLGAGVSCSLQTGKAMAETLTGGPAVTTEVRAEA